MYWRENDRIPLKEGSEFKINGITIVNDDEEEKVSKGSSCLVYHGHLKNEQTEGIVENSVIIKEFYPDVARAEVLLDIERDQKTDLLAVSESTKEKEAYQKSYEQFQQGFSFQKELSASEAMEIAVKPLIYGKAGDGYYVISDAHRGRDLKQDPPKTLEEKLSVAVGIAETMAILHETGYVMLDFKPENLLWIRKPNIIKIIDTDSLVPYRKSNGLSKLQLFTTPRLQSPELQFLKDALASGISDREFERKKRAYLKPASDLYMMGLYFYELFMEEPFEAVDFRRVNKDALKKRFLNIYGNESAENRGKLSATANALLTVLEKLLILDLLERRKRGYRNAQTLRNALNDICLGYTSVNYVPRKEIAKANATFTGYHMLQKYPLYEYADIEDGIRKLNVTIAGDHAMRKEILSAVISIGQMLDSELNINLAAKNAGEFWKSYISQEQNGALSKAVIWSIDNVTVNDKIDEHLVARSLAHINVLNDASEEMIENLQKEGCRYFILLSENDEENSSWLKTLKAEEPEKPVYIGCLQGELEKELLESSELFTVYPISAQCYSENYNENIFKETIFQMGLMVHAYYCECLDTIDLADIEKLKREFSADIYNVESSERCALHAMYKMASIGMQGNLPRKAQRFEKKLDTEPQVLEQLAWLEHLSWTASLLTTGAVPESMDNFNTFAYQGNNDWKNRKDPQHMGHPLLAASLKEMPRVDWMNRETAPQLDDLDLVSHKIYYWYIEHKEMFRADIRELFTAWKAQTPEEKDFMEQLQNAAEQCIDGIGEGAMNQDQTKVKAWKMLLKQASDSLEQKEFLAKVSSVMRPVLDSYKDRDYKQLDRKLVYAAASMIV